ncbi:glycosyltransferase [Clostridium oryzae]|uniref:Putative glycosyltransferase EpsJ n=1 Tax=Clostridium oryzae TaxID=1450648 RepID=A0A1V4ISC2_9CLOT|nr:glycosyltransferase family 2 protein [Clostridium oryzae]OPJ62710.1 putative glycosyltransferase EpsJ [Clostridium oryzae]
MISFIIACYNEGKNIERCISELLYSKDDFEVIIIDDGSTDDTYSVCKDIQCRNSRIRVYKQENKGVSAARNTGLNHAKGDWIFFADADDVLLKECIDIFSNYLSENIPIIQACQVYENSTFSGDNKRYLISSEKLQNIALNRKAYVNIVQPQYKSMIDSVHGVYCKLFNRAYLMKYGIKFVEGLGLGEDLLFYIEALEHCTKVILVNSPVYKIIKNANSSTRRFNVRMLRYACSFATDIYAFYKKNKKNRTFYINMCYQIYFHIEVGVVSNLCHENTDYSTKEKCVELKRVISIPIIDEAIETTYQHNRRKVFSIKYLQHIIPLSLLHKKKYRLFLLYRKLNNLYINRKLKIKHYINNKYERISLCIKQLGRTQY